MVTCDPDELAAPIHSKAMITILHPEDHRRWLECPLDDAASFQSPCPTGPITVRGPVFPAPQPQSTPV